MMRLVTVAGFVALITSGLLFAAPPETRKAPVTDAFHGVKVSEDYRWLEDWKNPEVKKWSAAQNAFARQVLDKLPNVDKLRKRVTQILSAKTIAYGSPSFAGGKLFAMKHEPPKQQPFLIVMNSADAVDSARVLVDPSVIDKEGHTHIDWYIPASDGKLVAVSLSKGGTESGDVHLYDVASGKEVHEMIPRVNGGTAGGDLAWLPDASGFFYTRYPRGKERPADDMNFYQQLYFHKLGTPTKEDKYEIGKDFPRIAEIQLAMDNKSGRLLVTVQKGDGGEFDHYLRSPAGKWTQFSKFGDKTVQATFGPKDTLYLVSRKDAPRGFIQRVAIADLEDAGKRKTIIEQGEDNIVTDFWESPTVLATDDRLYVEYQLGGPSEIRVFSLDGKKLPGPKQLDVSAVGSMTPVKGDEILFSNTSYIAPTAFYRFDPATGKTTKTGLVSTSPVQFEDAMVVREFAVSKDGTKVPVNIIMPKRTKLDGSNPCVVNGYGGYGVSLAPRFRATTRIMLDQGVIYAVANLRGGGEYGEEWHRQGNLTSKQNVFDDFTAVLQHMIKRGYTKSDKLGMIGGSNGGLLMGAVLVQHPELVKCVVSYVGIYDMLRVELSPNGAFNVTEFGTVKKKDHFQALYAYSPYHNVKNGTAYPATLFLTGANDPRVDPMQSRKMTARLQEANAAKTPILLRTSLDSGHGGGTPLAERIAQGVDVYAFLFKELGVNFK